MNLIELRADDPKVTDEELWAGLYGVRYTHMFTVDYRPRMPFLKRMLKLTGAKSVLDVGCNAGFNMRAIHEIDPSVMIEGVEINSHNAIAAGSLGFTVYVTSARNIGGTLNRYDLVMTSGVLIHVPTALLAETMQSIMECSRKYVLAVEYADRMERATVKHGDVERAWARPYGKLYEDLGLKLVKRGAAPMHGYPKCTYWLMEKP